ncbi:MAG: hypothetical protein AB9888_03580 [Bacteroidales bacterium]
MRKSAIIRASTIIAFIWITSPAYLSAQGIRIEGASLQIGTGATMNCNGGLLNSSGTVTNSGTLTLSGGLVNAGTLEGEGILYIGGDWVNSGTFNHGSGMVVFNGTAPQNIVAPYHTIFYDLEFSSAGAGTTIAPGTMVTVEGGVFNPNSRLIISSEGTENSGSLIYTGSGTPSGNLTYRRSMPGGTLYRYISSPVGSTVLPSTADFWAWDEPAGDWGDPVTACFAGNGYTVTTGGVPLEFTGPLVTSVNVTATSPYNTDYVTGTLEEYNTRAVRVPFGGGGWNLLGNPFTSAMRIGGTGGFLDANDGNGSTEPNSFDPNYVAVYIYDGDSYHYRGYDVSFPDPVVNEDPANVMFGYDNVQAGQGFFVLAMKNLVEFHFDRGMQTHATNTVLLKAAADEDYWPGFRLKATCMGDESFATVVFGDQMTTGLDPGYDVGLLSSGKAAEIYTSLVLEDNSVNFARQALPSAGTEQVVIPVGIDCEKGGVVVFDAFSVPLGDKKFWLEDRAAGTFTELGLKSYTVTLPADTYGTGRFFIVASANTPTAIAEPGAPQDGLRIWVSGERLVIQGRVNTGSLCEIFDMSGRKLTESRLSDGEMNFVDLPVGMRGLIVAKVTDGERVVTRKLALPGDNSH